MRLRTALVTLILVATAHPCGLRAQEAGDHPLVGRYEGSEIEAHVTRAFDEYVLPVGALQDGEFAETLRVEGEVTWIGYRVPDGRSTLEVFRNYEEHLSARGFEELFVCESIDACGYWFADRVFEADPERYLHAADTGADEGVRYLAARRSGDSGEAYVQIVVYNDGTNVWTRVRVIEPEARETDMIVVDADEMAEAVSAEGRVVLQGVHFETDEATIRPESEPQLEALAEFLSDHPDTDVYVVGHTDSQGTLEHNLDLSQRRAAAVVEALTSEHDVSAARLEPRGVGPLAPAATNRTEEGRAMNRRVVLVER